MDQAIAVEEVKKYVEKGVDDILDNKDDFIQKLSIASNIKPPKAPKVVKESGKTLKTVNELLKKDGHRIERDEKIWPLYHLFLQNGESHDIDFRGKVSEFYDIFLEKGIEGILELKNQVKKVSAKVPKAPKADN
jgi:hypothetical protein